MKAVASICRSALSASHSLKCISGKSWTQECVYWSLLIRLERRLASRMLSYFPALYPDELLYSGLARFAWRTSQTGTEAQLALFGTAVRHPHAGSPFNIGALTVRVPNLNPWTILRDHTLHPYLTGFLPRPRAELIGEKMIAGDRSTYSKLLSSTPTIQRNQGLRFCHQCMLEAEQSVGVRYWRRVHQLPLVVVCPEHGHALRISRPPPVPEHFIDLADIEASTAAKVVPFLTMDERQRLQTLAIECSDLLHGKYSPIFTRTLTAAELRRRILSKGYDYSDGRCEWRDVYEKAADELGWMRNIFPSFFHNKNVRGWLRRVANQPISRAEHLHLAAKVIDALPYLEPAFGHGPWDCVNPLSSHAQSNIVTNVRRLRTNGVTVATFTCDCGYVYTRQQTDKGDRSAPRFSRFGPTLRTYIDDAARNGWNITRAANGLGRTSSRLRQTMRSEQIADPWKLRRSRSTNT